MAISDKITSMTNHLKADYDSLESVVGEVTVDKNIENIAPILDTLYEELPKVTASGTELTINDTRAGKMKAQLMGNTSQTQKTGKNLLNIQTSSSSQFGITVTKNSDGTLTVNGTATADAAVIFNTSVTLSAGTYTLSGCPSGGSVNTYNLNLDQLSTMRDNGSGVTFTLNSERTSIAYVSVKSGVTMNNVIFKPMIVSGSTSGDFEPYTGKKATPNPDNPETINVVSGDNDVVVTGKNLLPLTNQDFSIGDLHYSVNGGVLQATGSRNPEVQRNNNNFKSNFNFTLPAGTYTIKYTDKGTKTGTQNLYIMKYSDDSEIQRIYATSNTFTLNEETKVYLGIYSYQLSITGTIEYEIMLESGSTATDFEPYQSSTYPINLPVENLFDLSNYNSLSQNGITATINTDTGEITLNGTSTATAYLRFDLHSTIPSGTIVSYSANNSSTMAGVYLNLALDGSTKQVLQLNSQNAKNQNITLDTDINRVYIQVNNGITLNNFVIKPQLEKGSKANSFTPYGTTPIELCKTGTYQDKFIRNSGKNLVEGEIENGSIDGSGYIGSNSSFKMWYAKITQGETYTVSTDEGNLVAGFFYTQPSLYSTSYNNSRLAQANKTFTAPITGYIAFRTTANYTLAQCELGNSSTPYEPYGNGDWYKEGKIEKVVFDGTQSVTRGDTATSGSYRFNITTPSAIDSGDNNYVPNILCNKLTKISRNQTYSNVVGISSNPSAVQVYLEETKTMSADSFKTWLSSNNLITYCVLSTPTYTKIEGTLKDELEAVWRAYSYNGQTNVTQSNNDLPFELSVTALEG